MAVGALPSVQDAAARTSARLGDRVIATVYDMVEGTKLANDIGPAEVIKRDGYRMRLKTLDAKTQWVHRNEVKEVLFDKEHFFTEPQAPQEKAELETLRAAADQKKAEEKADRAKQQEEAAAKEVAARNELMAKAEAERKATDADEERAAARAELSTKRAVRDVSFAPDDGRPPERLPRKEQVPAVPLLKISELSQASKDFLLDEMRMLGSDPRTATSIVTRGWMEKKSGGRIGDDLFRPREHWDRRYFVLQPGSHVLLYFKSHKDDFEEGKDEHGSVDLRRCLAPVWCI